MTTTRVEDRRRHNRTALACPAVIRDKGGRILLKGRSADVAPGGIRIIGRGGGVIREGQAVWVEISVEQPSARRRRFRIIKVRGQIRRISVMGEWRSVVVIVFDSDFHEEVLDPVF